MNSVIDDHKSVVCGQINSWHLVAVVLNFHCLPTANKWEEVQKKTNNTNTNNDNNNNNDTH